MPTFSTSRSHLAPSLSISWASHVMTTAAIRATRCASRSCFWLQAQLKLHRSYDGAGIPATKVVALGSLAVLSGTERLGDRSIPCSALSRCPVEVDLKRLRFIERSVRTDELGHNLSWGRRWVPDACFHARKG